MNQVFDNKAIEHLLMTNKCSKEGERVEMLNIPI